MQYQESGAAGARQECNRRQRSERGGADGGSAMTWGSLKQESEGRSLLHGPFDKALIKRVVSGEACKCFRIPSVVFDIYHNCCVKVYT